MKNNKLTYTTLSCLMTLVLTGCASPNRLTYEKSALANFDKSSNEQSSKVQAQTSDPKVTNSATFLAPMKSENPISPKEQLKQQQYQFSNVEPVKMAVENMPVRDFVHYVFNDLLAVNYVLDEAIIDNTQTVSLKIEEPIPSSELFELVADLLAQKQLSVQLKQKVFYVFKGSRQQKDKDILLGLGNNPNDVPLGSKDVLQLVPLKYSSYSKLERILVNLLDVRISAESDYAGITLKGSRSQVVRALNLIQLLDQPSAKSQYIGIYPLVFLTPNDFVTSVTDLLKQDGFDVINGVGFTPIEHLNSVIIHASEPHLLDRIEMWQRQIDKASDTTDKQYFIFYPKKANVATLGESLSNILALQKSGGTKPVAAKGKASKTSSPLDGIAIDEQRNAVVFYMQPKEYQAIYPLLTQLDVLPTQVIIEATLMEVTLTDKLSYGVEWFLKNSTDSFGTKDGLGKLPAGFNFTLTKPNLNLLMSALASTNQVNIVSNPKLMVSNGETATLNVGTEVPTITSTVGNATEGSGQVLQSIQYRSTGVTLSVKPTVNAQNFVELEVDQQLSEAGENALSGIDSPIVLKRDIQTKVLVEEGQTLILAGLISENASDKDSRVPILGDIPFVGELFKNSSETTVRTELLLMITPRIVNTAGEFKQLNKALGSKFQQIDFSAGF